MRKLRFLILISLLSINALYGQNVLDLVAKTDIQDKSVLLDKKLKPTLTDGENYKIKVSGLNSAVTSLKVVAKSFDISSTAPELLKTVLPGITTSLTGGILGFTDVNETLQHLRNNLNNSLNRLNKLKETSDELYKTTIFIPDTVKAKDALNRMIILYKNSYLDANAENIEAFVKQDIIYASTIKLISEEFLKKDAVFTREIYATLLSEINATNELIKEGNFLKYIGFIKKSTTAKSFVTSRSFYAEKDLVELKFSFLDTYTNDTVSTLTRTLYTKKAGGIGLSFSSGFFYTKRLSDIPYSLIARQDENLAVSIDKRVHSDISIGVLGHFYTNISSFLKTGPALGLSVSPFDGKSRYLIGWSFIIGREKMLSINLGQAWAKQKQLSSSVKTDDQGLYLPKGTSSLPTYDKIINNWFLGLSYNLATTRK